MKLNKKALYALANFYDRRNNTTITLSSKKTLLQLFTSCTEEECVWIYIQQNILHCEIFFRYTNTEEAYTKRLTDKNIAKLLRNIASNGKFPCIRSLKYE